MCHEDVIVVEAQGPLRSLLSLTSVEVVDRRSMHSNHWQLIRPRDQATGFVVLISI